MNIYPADSAENNRGARKAGCVDQACAKQNHETSHETSEERKKTKT